MSVASVPYSQLFDSESFTQILPFNRLNPLDAGVQSDHAEIVLKITDDRVINIWNISNPAYHCYFKYGDNPPFYNSHLFVEKPFIDGVMDRRLAEKTKDQINTIAERFVKGDVNIQIIVEGYESFYKDLTDKIAALGHTQFQIINLLEKKPDGWNPEWNVTGILVDTSRFSILKHDVIQKKYREEQDAKKEKDFNLPYAYLKDKATAKTMVVAGVHINGCGSQYPKTGLDTLAETISELSMDTLCRVDIIAAGDYNTPPANARTSNLRFLEPQGGMLLNAPYPTHVNPKSQAGNYDQVFVFRGEALTKYAILPADHVSAASQKLISSIERSRQALLPTMD